LYAVDGEIYKSGPFLSYEEAVDYVRKALKEEEFDLDEQYVYVLTPDHRLIDVTLDDITGDKDEEV
jgi:hypothetical protein